MQKKFFLRFARKNIIINFSESSLQGSIARNNLALSTTADHNSILYTLVPRGLQVRTDMYHINYRNPPNIYFTSFCCMSGLTVAQLVNHRSNKSDGGGFETQRGRK